MADGQSEQNASQPRRPGKKLFIDAVSPQNAQPLEEAARRFQELQTRQADLERQNEELCIALAKLQAEQARYFNTYDLAPVGYCAVNEQGLVAEANLTAAKLLCLPRSALINQPFTKFIFNEDINNFCLYRRLLFEDSEPQACELRMLRRGETQFWAHLDAVVAQDVDGTEMCRIMISDITSRKLTEWSLKESEDKTHSILENLGVGVALISPKMEILRLNRKMREWFPYIDPSQRPICHLSFNTPPTDPCDGCPTYKTLHDGQVHEAIMERSRNGAIYSYRLVSFPVFTSAGKIEAAIEMAEDITEKLELEAQLRQAQKLEAVGRLAGGVAHDFNNMLGVIIGHTELALGKVGPDHPLAGILHEILNAADRSAELTRQLLAFARKQTVIPKPLDLNKTVEGMLKMLRRLIGENIDLAWIPGQGECQVNMDPSQIDQILANLCINARDAISDVGKVTIATKIVSLDEAYCSEHLGIAPGDYVLLSVTDNGCGMDKETLEQMFEPFFTTKEVGKGTGLGLATIYGIVKQNNGFIDVQSDPGLGTSFNIHLPLHSPNGQTQTELPSETQPSHLTGNETILLVEDEPVLLRMAQEMLETLGYKTLAAAKPDEAIRLAKAYGEDIHLLVTDVVMPKMNGRELEEEMKAVKPQIKCLFISGYASNVLAMNGALDDEANFVQKPFTMQALSAKVREALDSKRLEHS